MAAFTKVSRIVVNWLAALSVFAYSSTLAYAQGCAMCYTSAAASKAGAIHALRSGILILLLPVLFMCSVISVVIYRSRNRFRGEAEWNPEQDRELRKMLAAMNDLESPGHREMSLPPVLPGQSSLASHPWTTDH